MEDSHSHEHFHNRFHTVNDYADALDDPERKNWQQPEQVIRALGIMKNDVVVDIGVGTGYFALRVAQENPSCTVIGVDVEPKMIERLEQHAGEKHLNNVHGMCVAPTEIPQLSKQAHLVFSVNVNHHIPNRVEYFRVWKSQLVPTGRVAIIDFTLESPHGPPSEHRVSQKTVVEELSAAGYALQESHDFLPDQYILLFSTIA